MNKPDQLRVLAASAGVTKTRRSLSLFFFIFSRARMAGNERSDALPLFDLLDNLAAQAVVLRSDAKEAKAQRKQVR